DDLFVPECEQVSAFVTLSADDAGAGDDRAEFAGPAHTGERNRADLAVLSGFWTRADAFLRCAHLLKSPVGGTRGLAVASAGVLDDAWSDVPESGARKLWPRPLCCLCDVVYARCSALFSLPVLRGSKSKTQGLVAELSVASV